MDPSLIKNYNVGGVKMKYSIDEILDMLGSDDKEIQEKGISIGSQIKNLKCFMRPIYGNPLSSTWENCAKIVCKRSDEELRPYFVDLLMWISDMNYPGASQVFDRLIQYDKDHLEWRLNGSFNLRKSMKYPLEKLINEANLNIEI